jgi:hypothetical protein
MWALRQACCLPHGGRWWKKDDFYLYPNKYLPLKTLEQRLARAEKNLRHKKLDVAKKSKKPTKTKKSIDTETVSNRENQFGGDLARKAQELVGTPGEHFADDQFNLEQPRQDVQANESQGECAWCGEPISEWTRHCDNYNELLYVSCGKGQEEVPSPRTTTEEPYEPTGQPTTTEPVSSEHQGSLDFPPPPPRPTSSLASEATKDYILLDDDDENGPVKLEWPQNSDTGSGLKNHQDRGGRHGCEDRNRSIFNVR